MESYGQTKSRIAGDEAPMEPKKKKRRGGNDSIDFLREKSQLELEIRKRELELELKGDDAIDAAATTKHDGATVETGEQVTLQWL